MPAIRYCTTPTGRVAYSTAGAGPPLLCDSGWITHLRGQLELFSFASFMARLAERFTVIRYDKPGCGLSDRDGIDLSFDGQVAAALAVADAARAGRFSLFGASQAGQLAAAIAAKCPERVESLVLYGTCASGADLAPAEVRDSIVALVRAHWGLGSKVLTGMFIPDPSAQDVEAFTRLQRASATAAVAGRLLEVYYDTDIRALLPVIQARTAVLHREADSATPFELGREVATLIPGAALIPLPGAGHLFYQGEWEPALEAVLGFLGEGPGQRPRLTRRELEVARLIADGLTNHAIATRLSVAPRTAEAHVENIRRKLEVRSRAQIAAWVTRHG
jgi:pimeloyl-ACP methyl ester carboxylesterase/DNA-binding CsgD family transcriptional regulator